MIRGLKRLPESPPTGRREPQFIAVNEATEKTGV
jgi:hypothetical protein